MRASPSRRGVLRSLAAAAGSALAALAGPAGRAWAQAGGLEAGVKAAFLYKFTAFVEWPATALAEPMSPLVIGVAGSPTVLAELRAVLAGRELAGRPLQSRAVQDGQPLDGLHVLFVGAGSEGALSSWLKAAAGRPLLLVSEQPDGLAQGSALNFVLVDGKVRFEASTAAAERAGLRLSARLLAVAQRVLP